MDRGQGGRGQGVLATMHASTISLTLPFDVSLCLAPQLRLHCSNPHAAAICPTLALPD